MMAKSSTSYLPMDEFVHQFFHVIPAIRVACFVNTITTY